jgi:hypothetical protein
VKEGWQERWCFSWTSFIATAVPVKGPQKHPDFRRLE